MVPNTDDDVEVLPFYKRGEARQSGYWCLDCAVKEYARDPEAAAACGHAGTFAGMKFCARCAIGTGRCRACGGSMGPALDAARHEQAECQKAIRSMLDRRGISLGPKPGKKSGQTKAAKLADFRRR
ncbi:hypothetical protein A3C96_01905 [Candidatus Uhrbacteria bacterium RIFCSPHIGHO2_02_FULL_60_10]|uniref:Uncharacterized protein n=1 Tax=Candidatus Uhrbacteria bacterium RIFCSPHIGHO2_02_FULL_60_10 TaxID=1802392 RepID=A0A1F7U5C3_9BACT|nr:MAG: hypothetical protein A3C96_01905 [Candidatus Uhrbacteria bacterium RIFCSPHIGHO2_02_FULL_60_10]